MRQAYFNPKLFQFLEQLRRNNRRTWFLKHKPEFEELGRQPSLRFITDLQLRLRTVSTWLVADPKPNGGSLFRVYRDVRFSKDKKPYKTHVGMNFWHASATEAVHGPGLYLHLEPKGCFLAGGIWQPDPRSLARIRDAIAWRPDEWRAAKRGLKLGGDTFTRPPRGYSADHALIEDLKRKDFVASIDFSQAQVCSGKFLEDFLRAAKKMTPLLKFLSEAVQLRF
ncbi:MAG: TIGR02453 family protein [Acidobacteria bacterium]|nr:TIGR02453 family protein [Acidobacteriota bacterium]